VGPFRAISLKHPLLALAIGFAALALRLAVPAGFMPVLHHGQVSLAPCPGSGMGAAGIAVAESPSDDSGHHDPVKAGSDGSCAFADLSLPLVGGADSVQLAAALLFIVAAALFFAAVLPPRAALRLRPPLRGPPLPT
jgi:hypothetical protein